MGTYVYKVTAKKKTLADGTEANVAVFAYKPVSMWNDEADKFNRGLAKKSGCSQAERFVRQRSKNFTGRAVLGEEGEVAVPVNRGTFTDAWFDNQVAKLQETV
jgi:hypothetical protein